jgi:Ni/Fe-hydrogenase b-type cytochrome subunit
MVPDEAAAAAADDAPSVTQTTASAAPTREVIRRHALVTRITHWINVFCIALLLMSGLQIFNAHPALYWGQKGADFDPHIFALPHGFPHWATIPGWQDLATGRLWHFALAWIFGANLLIYLLFGFLSGHFGRDFTPTRHQLAHFGQSIAQHLRLNFPKGEEARSYNVLQKFAYIGVVILLALMVATGFTMSPGVDSAFPWLLDLFGGRQSDRTLHFIFAWLIMGFLFIHLIAILAAGPINEIGSMITGRWTIEREKDGR